MFRYVVCCSVCHLTTCSLLRWYSVNDSRIRVIKHWWNDTTLVGCQVKMEWYKTRSLVNMKETTLVKWAGVWVKGQRNKNIIWKNGTLTSQNPHYMPVKKDKSLAGHGLVFYGLSPLLLTANTNGSHAIFRQSYYSPQFGDIPYLVPFDRGKKTQMRFNSSLLFFLRYVFLCVWFYLHELSVLVVLYFTIFVFTQSYLYFIICYLDL